MRVNMTRVDLILLCMVVVWGANITVIKVALQHFDPLVFNFFRFLIASGVMLLLYRDALKDRMDKKELFSLMILGVLGNTIYQLLFINGVKLTLVSHTSILLGTTPIFTAAFASWTGFDDVRKRIWAGILLSFCGVILIVFGGNQPGIEKLSANIGDLFILIASFVWSIYTTYSRNVIREYSSRHYLLYTVVFGTFFMIPFSVRPILHQNWEIVTTYDFAALSFSALLALVFGYSAWYYGVEKLGSTRTSVYSNLTPVAGMAIGMIFLHERLSLLQWLGAAVIFTGLLLNRLTQPALSPAAE
jgi:drug/metabolite transporter (DMT)-like permease